MCGKRNSHSKTDTDTTFIRMKEDHMLNRQLKPGKYANRKITLSPIMARQKKEATQRITTEEGIILRMNRSIQVEGAFGVIKQDFAFRRFLTRGKTKTETQVFLVTFAFNIQKL